MPGRPDLPAVFVVVIAAVGVDLIRALAGPAAAAAHRRDGLDQGHELGDVVAVAAGQRHRQRDAVRFGDQVVLRAGPGTVDRARTGFGPPFSARTWELSITARDQSRAPAAFSSASSDSCSRCQTPASLPVPQPPPARHPRPEAQLLRQELPRDARVQDKQDPGQDFPVIQPLAARMISPAGDHRQQRPQAPERGRGVVLAARMRVRV